MSDEPDSQVLELLRAMRADVSEQSAAIRREVADIRSLTIALDDKVQRLDRSIQEVKRDMHEVKDDLELLRAMRAEMASRDDFTKLRSDLMERLDRLQHTVDLVKDDVTVNYGASDRTERVAKAAFDDSRALGDIVRVMQRQIAKLRTDLDQLRDAGDPSS